MKDAMSLPSDRRLHVCCVVVVRPPFTLCSGCRFITSLVVTAVVTAKKQLNLTYDQLTLHKLTDELTLQTLTPTPNPKP